MRQAGGAGGEIEVGEEFCLPCNPSASPASPAYPSSIAGGGVANPYNFDPTRDNLYVWYAFPYPAGVAQMVTFHNTSLVEQLTVAATW